MKKRFLSIFLIIILAVTNLTVSYASGLDALTNINLNNYGSNIGSWEIPGQTETNIGKLQDLGDSASGIIRTVLEILFFPLTMAQQLLIHIVAQILPMMDTIVFNQGIWGSITRLTFFDSDESTGFNNSIAGQMQGVVSSVYQVFRYVALTGFVVAIACIAVKMILSSIGKQKQQYKEALKNWLVGLMLLVVGHWVMIYIIYFSYYLVDFIQAIGASIQVKSNPIFNQDLSGNDLVAWAFGSQGTLYSAFSEAIGSTMASFSGIAWRLIGVIINLIVIIVFIAMNMKIFKVYLERVIVVAVLIMLFPLVTVFYAFEKAGLKKGQTFSTWMSTFVSQVFIQPVHALSLVFIILVLQAMGNISIGPYFSIYALPIIGPIFILMVINFVFKIEEVVKRIFAISGPSMGQPISAGKEVGKLARGAANMAVNAGTIARRVKSGIGPNKLLSGGILKDELLATGKNLAKKSGVNIDRLFEMDLVEAKNVEKQMKADVKSGTVTASKRAEYRRRMHNNKNGFENAARFGFKDLYEWEKALDYGNSNDPAEKDMFERAMLAMSESIEPGSAMKYMDESGNLKNGAYAAFRKEQEGVVDKEIEKYGKGDRSVGTDAIKAKLFGDDKLVEQIRLACQLSAGYDVIGNLDDDTQFTQDARTAIAWAISKGDKIDKYIKYDANSNRCKCDMTRVNPMETKQRRKALTAAVDNGTYNTFETRKAVRSEQLADRQYFDGVVSDVESKLGVSNFDQVVKDYMSDGIIQSGYENAIEELVKVLNEDEIIAAGGTPTGGTPTGGTPTGGTPTGGTPTGGTPTGGTPTGGTPVARRVTRSTATGIPVGGASTGGTPVARRVTRSTATGIPVGGASTGGTPVAKRVTRSTATGIPVGGASAGRATPTSSASVSEPSSYMHLIMDDNQENLRTTYEANAGVSIEDFANEIMRLSNENDMNLDGRFNNFDFSTGNYESAADIIDTYNKMPMVVSTLRDVVNAGTDFDTIGFTPYQAEAFETYIQNNEALFNSSLADVNAITGFNSYLDKQQVMNIVKNGRSGNPNEMAAVRLIIDRMINRI